MRCPSCKKPDSFRPWKGTIDIMGIELRARGERCKACGETLFDAEEAQRHDRATADALVERGIHSGRELQLVRKAAGLKATELAEILGVTAETVSRWERDKIEVPRATAYIVAELYEHPRRTRQKLEALAGEARASRQRGNG
jgi:putative zinc finger/helix-turn-helix YgiT family protein